MQFYVEVPMNQRTVHELGLNLGDMALLLSSISGIIDQTVEATDQYNCFGFRDYKHLSERQCLVLFLRPHAILPETRGCPGETPCRGSAHTGSRQFPGMGR